MPRIIQRDRSIIPACDFDILKFGEVVKATGDIEGVGGYKIGFVLGLTHGLQYVVEVARKHTDKPLIYDHQKAGTDIPDMGTKFAGVLSDAGINAAILFPQAGPVTEEVWIKALQDKGLGVIVGGLMTHKGYVVSDGGYITDGAIMDIYLNAAKLGVIDFVVPGNKPEAIIRIKRELEGHGIEPVFYAPGFVAQGGEISESAKIAGERFHGIIGRGIYETGDIKQAALDLTSKL